MSHYAASTKALEADIKAQTQRISRLCGIRESDTGLNPPSHWDLAADKALMQEQSLQVARCTKIIPPVGDGNSSNGAGAGTGRRDNPAADVDADPKYIINVKQIAKFVVGLGEKVAAVDIEEGMRVG